jgi:hypothetical protein
MYTVYRILIFLSSEKFNLPCPVQKLLSLMEMNLPNPKAVWANEAFPKGSPRPDFFSTLNKPRHRQASLPVSLPFFHPSMGKKMGEGKKNLYSFQRIVWYDEGRKRRSKWSLKKKIVRSRR